MPGIEISSGSLGQGLSVGVGMALAAKYNKMNHRIFVIMGDGDLQEGSVWEAAMSAGHYKLNNLIAIVDRNHKQIDGNTSDVIDTEPLQKKWEAFGWKVLSCNGNSIQDFLKCFKKIKANKIDKPHIIIARTIMGKGVKSIENDFLWHGKAPSKKQATVFIKEVLSSISR